MIGMNVEMPTKCSECPCYDPEFNMCNLTQRRFGFTLKEYSQQRPSDCPLVPNVVPKTRYHGDRRKTQEQD